MGRACNQNGERQECFQNFTSKPIGKRLLGGPRRRWDDNIRMNVKEIGIITNNWVDSGDYWSAL